MKQASVKRTAAVAASTALLALPMTLPVSDMEPTANVPQAYALGWDKNEMIMYGPAQPLPKDEKSEALSIAVAAGMSAIATAGVAGGVIAVRHRKRKSSDSNPIAEDDVTTKGNAVKEDGGDDDGNDPDQ